MSEEPKPKAASWPVAVAGLAALAVFLVGVSDPLGAVIRALVTFIILLAVLSLVARGLRG